MSVLSTDSATPVLEVEDLTIAYDTRGGYLEAVKEIAFRVRKSETLALVGESGCGKSTVAFGIVNFLGPNGKIENGSVRFQGNELVGRSQRDLKQLRGDRIAMVYQDPMQALNPSVPLGDQLIEVLTSHNRLSKDQARQRSIDMLGRVNMPDPGSVMKRYTHQISGGQQQRVVIAMAMLNNPALLIMDEPTTALDVTIEASVLDLIEELKDDFRTATIFITHNLGVAARVSDRVCVMYAGQMVEWGPVTAIFQNPRHPYTLGLLACVPRPGESKLESRLHPIRGRVPPPTDRPEDACIFAPRCDWATKKCREERPGPVEITPGHEARCFYALQLEDRSLTPESGVKDRAGQGQVRPRPESPAGETLLTTERLKVFYTQNSNAIVSLLGLGRKRFVKAVDDVSFRVSKKSTLGIVGESGCGKSTLAKGIIGLEPVAGGKISFLGVDTTRPVSKRDTKLVQEMQMVFQNPDATLNPSFCIGKQIARPIRRFETVQGKRVREEVHRLLDAVHLDAGYYDRLPRQLSGGEKQRVGIARALASRPDLILCDEPVSSLDVSVQAAVLNLLLEVQQTFGTAMIFIAHDLSVVRYFSDDIIVMYLGQIVEMGPAQDIYDPPYHPYTEALLSAVPLPDPAAEKREIRLTGTVPSALNPPTGCHFHTRCPRKKKMLPNGGKICEEITPPSRESGPHLIMCHIPLEELAGINA